MQTRFFIGLDLGQSKDFTAISVVERTAGTLRAPVAPIPPRSASTWIDGTLHMRPAPKSEPAPQPVPPRFECRHLERVPLGTLYPAIVEKVKALMQTPELEEQSRLVVDATGVGRPVVDMLRAAGLNPKAILITGGDTVSTEGEFTRVPKRELVSILQVTMQDKRLGFAESLPMIQTLVSEMMAFQVKINTNAHDSYGSWREGSHDDLVLAVALAVWEANRGGEITMTPEAAADLAEIFGY